MMSTSSGTSRFVTGWGFSLKVLYFSLVQIAGTPNGGMIACRSHISRLANINGCNVHVAIPVAPAQIDEHREVIECLGAIYHPIILKHSADDIGNRKRYDFSATHPIPWELWSRHQAHTDTEFRSIVDELGPDVLVVDHLYSYLCVRSVVERPVSRVIVIHNNETRHFTDQCQKHQPPPGSVCTGLARRRLEKFERAAYHSFDCAVALSDRDIPDNIEQSARVERLPPVLAGSEIKWASNGSKTIFYVGNVAHHPNKEAMRWIIEELNPVLTARLPEVKIALIGATSDDFGEHTLPRNIQFLGNGDASTVRDQYLNSGLLIAPIRNMIGTKMKILEALSYGTPFLASAGALSGLGDQKTFSTIDLEAPSDVVDRIETLLYEANKANEMHRAIVAYNDKLESINQDAWKQILDSLAAKHRTAGNILFRKGLLGDLIVQEPSAIVTIKASWPFRKILKKSFDIALDDWSFVKATGFYGVEVFRGKALRWTDGAARLIVKLPQLWKPYTLVIELGEHSPAGDARYQVLINDRLVTSDKLSKRRIIKVQLRKFVTERAIFGIDIRSNSKSSEADPRRLGVQVTAMKLRWNYA